METMTTATHVGVSETLEPRYCSVNEWRRRWDSTVASNNTETDTPKLYILIFDVFYTF